MERDIMAKASSFGVEFAGFAPAMEIGKLEWPVTVIILASPLMLPLIETCPSIWGLEHERTVKILLAKAVNRVCAFLNAGGYKAEAVAASADELSEAASRAGLGSRGKNGRLLTRRYGPRVMMDALVTSREFELAGVKTEEFCSGCGNCQRACPAAAARAGNSACAAYGRELARDFKNPCWRCLRSCPVGDDRVLYDSFNFKKYFDESEIFSREPASTAYKPWRHIRSYGSYPHAEIKETLIKLPK